MKYALALVGGTAMNGLGNKIAKKRKDLGMTQTAFAEKLSVTRQTVSRWEAGSVMPDIDKIGDIAGILGVSCDYLLRDSVTEETGGAVGRLLQDAVGRKVKLNFYDGEGDYDLLKADIVIEGFEGNWVRIAADSRKGHMEKLIPLSSVLSIEFVDAEQGGGDDRRQAPDEGEEASE